MWPNINLRDIHFVIENTEVGFQSNKELGSHHSYPHSNKKTHTKNAEWIENQ